MTLSHSLLSSKPQGPKPRLFLILLFLTVFLAGCAQAGQMADQPRYDPLEASAFFADGVSARTFPQGVVAYSAENPGGGPETTGLDEQGQPLQGFPVEINQDLVAVGQEQYDIYCVPCHGPAGAGDGKATLFAFPKPPDLLGETSRALSNGDIFGIITHGRGLMYPYGYRVKAPERWAIIAYMRAMQLHNGAVNPSELTETDLSQLGTQP